MKTNYPFNFVAPPAKSVSVIQYSTHWVIWLEINGEIKQVFTGKKSDQSRKNRIIKELFGKNFQ